MATATAEQAATDHDEHHPTPRFYVQVALVLAVLTAMEFSTYFIDFGPLAMPLLLVLMAIKFAMIVGFFMHLKFDTPWFTRLMITGLVGALVLYGIVALAVFELPPSLTG